MVFISDINTQYNLYVLSMKKYINKILYYRHSKFEVYIEILQEELG